MNEIDAKIAGWLKSYGQTETIKKVKKELKCSVAEAKEIVDKHLKENPAATIHKTTAKETLYSAGILIALIIIIWAGCKSCGGDAGKPTVSDLKLNAMVLAQMRIEKQLKAPSTADFESRSSDDIVQTDTVSNIYTIHSYVDAENSYGVKIRINYKAELKYLGGAPDSTQNWQVLRAELFE